MTTHWTHPDFEGHCLRHSQLPSPICQEIYDYTYANVPIPTMLIGPMEGSFLRFLIQLVGARRILEFGTFTGYSALAMAEALPEDGRLITLDINAETTAIAKSFWAKSPHGRKITSLVGNAAETLAQARTHAPFDFIFIDADKEQYRRYLEEGLTLLSPHGLIAVDNCFWYGKVLDPAANDSETSAVREFNAYVKGRADLVSTLAPIRDGLFLIRPKRGNF